MFKRVCGLSQIVKVLTRDTGILDWCLTNRPKLHLDPAQLPNIGASDYFCVLVRQTKSCFENRSKLVIRKRDTTDSCLREFGRWITSFSWHELLSASSCEQKLKIFMSTMNSAIDKYFPLKDKPWISPQIKTWIAKRQHCLAKFGKDSHMFKLWRNKVPIAIVSCKKM